MNKEKYKIVYAHWLQLYRLTCRQGFGKQNTIIKSLDVGYLMLLYTALHFLKETERKQKQRQVLRVAAALSMIRKTVACLRCAKDTTPSNHTSMCRG